MHALVNFSKREKEKKWNKITDTCNIRCGKFIRDMMSSAKGNPKASWRHINEKRKSNSLPKNMNYSNTTATSDVDKANLFAKFFSSVYQKHQTDHGDLKSFIENRLDNNCHGISISADSVISVLGVMDINKGIGYDGVPSLFLRQCAEILCDPLSTIFSQSIKG